MAEGDVQPVVIPVEVRPDFSRLDQMPDAIRRIRDRPGVLGEDSGAPGTATMSPLEHAKLETLREYQTLETQLRAVNAQFARFVQLAGATRTETTPALAHPATTGGAASGAPPSGGGVPPSGTPPRQPPPGGPTQPAGIDVGQLMQTLLYGGTATIGLGLGITAMFTEFSRMISTSREVQGRLYLAAQGAGFGGAVETPTLEREILRPQGRHLAPPDARIAITAQLRRLGLRDEGTRGTQLADLAQMTGTDAGGLAAETYRMARRDPGTAMQTSVLEYARQGQLGAGETLDQLRQLVRLTGQQGGQGQRSQRELDRIGDLVAVLNSLSGQVGRGQGGIEIAQSIQSGSQGGLGALTSMMAFRRQHPDANLSDSKWIRRFEEFRQTPAENIPGVFREMQRPGYGDEDVRALRLARQFPNIPMRVAGEIVKGGPRADALIKQYTEQESRAALQREIVAGAETPGGAGLEADALRRGAESADTVASKVWRSGQRLFAAAPGTTGTILGLGSVALAGRATYGYLRGRSAIGATAGRGGVLGRLSARLGRMSSGKLLGRSLGALSAAGDIASLATGTPDWWGMAGGVVGAGIGAAVGGPWGAVTGYGIGKTAVEYGRGLLSPAQAEAAVNPADMRPVVRDDRRATMGLRAEPPGGWHRDEVIEHLALLRQLVLHAQTQPEVGGGSVLRGGGYVGGFGGAGGGAASTTRPSENGALPPELQPQESAIAKIQRLAGGPEPPSPLASRELPGTLRLQEPTARGPAIAYQERDLGGGAGKITANDPRLVAAAKKFGIPLSVAQGLVKQESGFTVGARGGAGEYGLTQLMPGTAREMGVQHPLDVQENLEGGFGYLRKQIDFFKARGMSEEEATRQGLAAYNAGRGGALKGRGQGYAASVLHNADRFAASSAGEPSAAAQTTALGGKPDAQQRLAALAATVANPQAGATSRNPDGTVRIQGETAGMSRDVDARGKIVATQDTRSITAPATVGGGAAPTPQLSARDLAILQRERELQVSQGMHTPARDPVAERSEQILASRDPGNASKASQPVQVRLSLDSEIQGLVAARTEQPGSRQRVGG